MILLSEVFDAIVMTLGIGYIFMDMFRNRPVDVVDVYSFKRGFNWNAFWFACMAIAPAIVLHEAAHKFVAQSFGLTAIFHAHYMFLGLGIILKLLSFGFIFFVPGYVSILGSGTNLQFALIAFAGPFIHALFWLAATVILKNYKLKKNYFYFWTLTKRINGFLFILNMLPIPGIDVFGVFSHLFRVFF